MQRAPGIDLKQSAETVAMEVENGGRRAWKYFGLPVYFSESSSGNKAEKRTAYIEALGETVARLRKENFPLVDLNWWPLFETIQ